MRSKVDNHLPSVLVATSNLISDARRQNHTQLIYVRSKCILSLAASIVFAHLPPRVLSIDLSQVRTTPLVSDKDLSPPTSDCL